VAARFKSVEPLQRTLDIDNWAVKVPTSKTLDGPLKKACIPRVKRVRNHRNFVLGTSWIFGLWKSHTTQLHLNRQPTIYSTPRFPVNTQNMNDMNAKIKSKWISTPAT